MTKKDYIAPILLVFPIIILPLEGLFPFTVAGLSVTSLSIIPLALYALFIRPKLLLRNFTHPCILIGLFILGWGLLSETLHELSSYGELVRNAQNLAFAVIVATLIIDTRPMRAALAAWIAVSTVLAVYFILALFAKVNVPVETYLEAAILRHEALADIRLDFNWNTIGYIVGIGAVAAIGILLEKPANQYVKLILTASAICCTVGSAVILYRGPILMILLAGGTMLAARIKERKRRVPILVIAVILTASVALIPEALPKRFQIKLRPSYPEEYIDPRVRIYSRAIALMPQYFLKGVGKGGYYESWGPKNGLIHNYLADMGIESAVGLHNAFLQFFVFYGVAALLLLLLFTFRAKRCLLYVGQDFPFFVTIRGLAVSGFVIILFSNSLYNKELGLIMGMLIAAERLGRRCGSS